MEKFTNLPMPFTKLQKANEQIDETVFNSRTSELRNVNIKSENGRNKIKSSDFSKK